MKEVNSNSQVTCCHVVLGHEGLLRADNLVDAVVGVEVGLDVVEDHDRPVGTSATNEQVVSRHDYTIESQYVPEFASGGKAWRYADSIVEGPKGRE